MAQALSTSLPMSKLQQVAMQQAIASQLMSQNQTITSSSGSTSTYTNSITTSSSNGTIVIPTQMWVSGGGGGGNVVARRNIQTLKDQLIYSKDFTGEVELPDGGKLIFDNGNYHIEDKDAKITYKGNRNREFNKYLNSSDLLQEFIGYLGSLNLSKQEVLQIPIETFIMWLIISAAEADQEDRPEQEILLLEHKVEQLKTIRVDHKLPRCKCCGRFINHSRKKAGIEFCSGTHMDKWFDKKAA